MVEIFDLTRKKELEVYFKDIEEYYKKPLEVLGISDDLDLSLIIFCFIHITDYFNTAINKL